jgi:hypothetical protein
MGMKMNTYHKLVSITKTLIISTLLTITSLSVNAEIVETVEKNELDLAIDKAVSVFKSITGTEDVIVDEKSFSCIRKMTPVRHFYVDNLLGDIESTLEAANAPEGAVYPAGSVVQLVPTEVMVKRELGTSPATGDWEFFELEVNEEGSKIAKRGFVDVVNRFDGNCFSCHAPAREKWDFICESGHGCEPIPIDHKMTGALQRSDPRCGEAVPEDGDTMALFKLKAMVTIGLTKKWLEDLF